jgi:phenylacetate-CoA ligase
MQYYSKFLRKTALPIILAREGRYSALKHWRFFEKSQYWKKQELLDFQWGKLKKLLQYSYDNSPYYKGLFDERGLSPDSFKSFEDLRLLPPLTRDLVSSKLDEILSRKFDKSSVQIAVSGGTTAHLVKIYRDKESANIKAGMAWRHEGWMGRRPCEKMAYVWPAHVDFMSKVSWKTHIKNRHFLREVYYYAGSGKDETMQSFYNDLVVFKAKYLKVFPSALTALTNYLMKKEIKPPRMEGILSTGEALFETQRRSFESFYGCPIFNMYGSRETGNTASECSAHSGLHIAMETTLVEFVKDGNPVSSGQEGEILLTDLTNYAFPMIRYRIGDYGILKAGTCECGRELQLMSPSIGRVQDYIWGPDGTCHSGVLLSFIIDAIEDLPTACMDDCPGSNAIEPENRVKIGQMQIVQESKAGFLVRIVPKRKLSSDAFMLVESMMKKIIGEGITVKIEIVSEIPRDKSGKMRFVISEIHQSHDSDQ